MIYLDHNATTPLDERVSEAMEPYLTAFYGNPSSLYRLGRISRDAIETAREQVAALVNAHSSQIIFTSGGTEANNQALQGLAKLSSAGTMAASATAHPSVLEALKAIQRGGWKLHLLPVDSDGLIAGQALEEVLLASISDLRFVSLLWANNETGVVQDIAALSDKLRERAIWVHCDAVQAAGKIPVDFARCGAHLLSLSGHKIYGPKGVGALVFDKSLGLEALIHGGGQEKGLRGGTENVPAIVGFGMAAELARQELEQRRQHVLKLRRRLEAGLKQLPGVMLFAERAERLPNTAQFGMEGLDGSWLVMELDRRGIAVSSGSACSSGGTEPSHGLLAMGIAESLARSAIRVSFGLSNTEADVEQFLAALQPLLNRLRVQVPA